MGLEIDVQALPDEALLRGLQADDKTAFAFLFERYKAIATALATRILRNRSEAEDLVQDFFLFLHGKCHTFDRSKGSASSWIIQWLYYRAFDRRRRLSAGHFYDHEGTDAICGYSERQRALELDYDPDTVFGRNGLARLLKSLSVEQRETLRLHFFEGYTLAEISHKWHQPLGTVRHHYYRGLEKLRKQLFGPRAPGSEHKRKQ
jgi:RNA polymerase sigma-70 factor, ECF subfamily